MAKVFTVLGYGRKTMFTGTYVQCEEYAANHGIDRRYIVLAG